jgi:histidinol-phosphate aminotransferase
MDWITAELAIGNIEDAMDVAGLRAAGIRSVLSLSDFPDLAWTGLRWQRIVLRDGLGNPPERLGEARDRLGELVAGAPKVLVHCIEGKSRSAAVVALYLAAQEGLSLAEACRRVQARRPVAAIQPGLLDGWEG